MAVRLISLLLILMLCCGTGLRADAAGWEIHPQDKTFVSVVEAAFPGWKATFIGAYWSGGKDRYEMLLMRIAEGMLWSLAVYADAEDTAGENWGVIERAPVPLTEAGSEKAAGALETFVLATDRYWDAEEFLADFSLLPEAARILLRENEKLISLSPWEGYLAGIAEDEAGLCSLRIADWDGTAYRKVIAAPMQAHLDITEIHSTDGLMEIRSAAGTHDLVRSDDGSWHLRTHMPKEGGSYFLTGEGIVDRYAAEYDPDCSNDAWHYGTPEFATALPDLVFAEIPGLDDAVLRMDAGGWACVKTEGAQLCDAPDGETLAVCFTRLPGRVLEQTDGWTCLQIGSEQLGLKGWFRTADLAFGAETETVICGFPAFDCWMLRESPLGADICLQLDEDPWGLDCWLIGKTTSGEWLLLFDRCLVRTAPAELVGETQPARHWWLEF